MTTARTILYRDAGIASRLAGAAPDEAAVDPYTFDVVASDESVDTFETSLRGWSLARFAANPVVLYAHDHTEPVGQAENVRMADGALRMTVRLAEAGTSPTVDKVRSLRRQGILRGVSVGFMPSSVSLEERDGREVMVLAENELLELSVCAVPANANALAEMRAAATRAPGRTTPRPTMTTKKTAAQTRETKPEDMPPTDKPKAPAEASASEAEHQVYVDELTAAVGALEGFDDAQRATVLSAVMAALESASAKVDAMEPAEDPAMADAVRAAAGASTTIEHLSREVGELRAAMKATEQRAEAVERAAIIERAKADQQWSLALEPFLGTQSLEQLRAWKKSAPRVVPGGEIAPPTDASTNDRQLPVAIADAVARATKDGWLSLPAGERAAITRESPTLATRLRSARKG